MVKCCAKLGDKLTIKDSVNIETIVDDDYDDDDLDYIPYDD